jgi:hypothetical protein
LQQHRSAFDDNNDGPGNICTLQRVGQKAIEPRFEIDAGEGMDRLRGGLGLG